MTTTQSLQRRLIRTKEAANYLSMSDWKLRRLIQERTFPVLQDHEGGPFLLDVRDLVTTGKFLGPNIETLK